MVSPLSDDADDIQKSSQFPKSPEAYGRFEMLAAEVGPGPALCDSLFRFCAVKRFVLTLSNCCDWLLAESMAPQTSVLW
jgi:hypothetical protein